MSKKNVSSRNQSGTNSSSHSSETYSRNTRGSRANRPTYVGARNPYALADAIRKKMNEEPIPWHKIMAERPEDRISILQETFLKYSLMNENLVNEMKNSKIQNGLKITSFLKKGTNSETFKSEITHKPLEYANLFDPANYSPIFPRRKNHPNSIFIVKSPDKKKTSEQVDVGSPWDTACTEVVTQWSNISQWNKMDTSQTGYPRIDAPLQGCPPNCWLIAALSSIAWTSTGNNNAPIQQMSFRRRISLMNFSTPPVPMNKPPTNYLPLCGNKPAYANSRFNEIWPSIFEYHMTELIAPNEKIPGTTYPNIPNIGPGDPQSATANIEKNTYGPPQRKENFPGNTLTKGEVWHDLQANCNQMVPCIPTGVKPGKTLFPTVAWTYCTSAGTQESGCTAENTAPTAVYGDEILVARHAYSLLGYIGMDIDECYVILRNPWGGIPDTYGNYYLYAPPDGSRNYTLADPLHMHLYDAENPQDYLLPQISTGERPVKDGIFGLKLTDFVEYFAGYGWVVPR